ncbi:phosphotransferase family protein [Pelagibius litoralis]|uniref:phosphotransferase family protein n=1 Tax=Pelagibius litoralis TaxID=374515 RepID=UPI0019810393|nr:phosphotransferase family protein [Pelagibius litoralis]
MALAESRLARHKETLEAFLAEAYRSEAVDLDDAAPLTGGAIQENWLLDLRIHGGPDAGQKQVVLRTDAASGVAVSRSRAEEFTLLQVAKAAGVLVPEPLWLCEDPAVLGKTFYVMARAEGTAAPHRFTKEPDLGGDRERLAERLGMELAKIHSIQPPREELSFLGEPPAHPALVAIERYRDYLDSLGALSLALEWGLRWCELHAPPSGAAVLVHQDFRTGNYMIDRQGLTAILDWEFCDWGDPMSDIGWFCAKCWRYAQPELEAGGIGSRAAFYRGYADVTGRSLDPQVVAYWEVMAHLRWAVIALQQGERALSGEEDSLELALTGRIYPPGLEGEILRCTEPALWRAAP